MLLSSMNETIHAVFQQLSITNAQFLGKGATSQVYDIGDGQVLRILGEGSIKYIKSLVTFYEQLNRASFPFAVPRIEEYGTVTGVGYIIERHLPGYDMSTIFPQLDQKQRKTAFCSFLDGLPPIHAVMLPDEPYGELLGWHENIRHKHWSGFLRDRTFINLKESLPFLNEDLPKIDHLIADFVQRVAQLPDPQKHLVHGDYFLANVMCNQVGQLTAVFDFSPLTLIGDPWFDVAGALTFLRVFDFITEGDIAFAEQEINNRYGDAGQEEMALYTAYNCLYFANSKEWDPNTYRWCLYHLERYPFL